MDVAEPTVHTLHLERSLPCMPDALAALSSYHHTETLTATPLIILRSYNVTRLGLSLVAAPGPGREGDRQFGVRPLLIWNSSTA